MEWIMRRSRMQMEENEGEREKKGGGGGELKQLRVKCLARGMFQRLVESVFATEDNNFKGGIEGRGLSLLLLIEPVRPC